MKIPTEGAKGSIISRIILGITHAVLNKLGGRIANLEDQTETSQMSVIGIADRD